MSECWFMINERSSDENFTFFPNVLFLVRYISLSRYRADSDESDCGTFVWISLNLNWMKAISEPFVRIDSLRHFAQQLENVSSHFTSCVECICVCEVICYDFTSIFTSTSRVDTICMDYSRCKGRVSSEDRILGIQKLCGLYRMELCLDLNKPVWHECMWMQWHGLDEMAG